jgi:hypothetical protein
MYGLGSGNRVIGAIGISSPRTKNGSAGRVYAYLKNTLGSFQALAIMRDYTGLGPFIIKNGRLVYN